MDDNFSQKVKDVIAYSKEEAIRLGHDFIGTEHLVLGLLRKGEGSAIDILIALDINLDLLRKKIEALNPVSTMFAQNQEKLNLHLTKQAEKALKTTFLEAKLFKSSAVETVHLFVCILRNENDPTTKLLETFDINYKEVKTMFSDINDQEDEQIFNRDTPRAESSSSDDFSSSDPNPFDPKQGRKGSRKSKTPVLDNFGRDLTALAEQDALDPVVGRQKEIERVSQILSRRKKNNPMLIGEPGVGKSAIAEGLALRIVQRKVSRILFDKRLISLDLASLGSGNKI